jgi:cyclopropane fatty-acyl-phospholipid synthase-like methyltransferase
VDAVPEAALSALDVGCGAGDNARLLHQRRKLVDGITLSDTEAQAAGQWCRRDAGFLQLKQKFLAVSQAEVEARLSRHELLDNTVVF